jgi:hypothetical protein
MARSVGFSALPAMRPKKSSGHRLLSSESDLILKLVAG